MIKRIDIFMPPHSRYGVLHHLTRNIYEALLRLGVDCRLLVAQYDNPEPFLESIFSSPPECTFSLNGLLPDQTGRFFCDMIKIPHIASLVDSPNQFVELAKCRRNIVTCPDYYATHVFKNLNCENVLFIPHGVDRNIQPDPQAEKKFDVVFLGSCIDYEEIRNSWIKRYPKNLCKALDEAAEIALSDQTTPYVEAFVDTLNNNVSKSETLKNGPLNLMTVLDELEMYIRGKDRVLLIKSIQDAKIDLFGSGALHCGWEKYIDSSQKNVTLHSPVAFEQALSIMKQSKIVLNSSPWIKNGGHERIFSGMATGALVVTSENPYMKEHFKNGSEIVYYYYGRWQEVNDPINTYLSDESKRLEVVEKGREKIASAHTWDHRMKTLLDALPKILEKIKERES